MAASTEDIRAAVRLANFPMGKREIAIAIVSEGLKNFRSGSKRSYVSHTGKQIKKPTSAHAPAIGRHDQTPARNVLISALCRAWIQGMGKNPTLNNKNAPDSDFFKFARAVMGAEGIGHIHSHLEEYWSTRKKTEAQNARLLKNGDFPGGVAPKV